MRKDITVGADMRESRGKNAARRVRAGGRIPAVLYGSGGASLAVAVNPKEINRILHSATGHNTIFDLDVQGVEKSPVMVVDWLHDPIKSNLLHVDFKRIDLSQRLRVKVPVHFKGDPAGVKTQGGLFEVVTREIEIECLPDDIPEHFEVDVAPLLIGQNLRHADVALGGSVRLVGHGDTVLCHVVATRASETAAAPEEPAAAAAEPEVIKKGKKEEEGEAKPKK